MINYTCYISNHNVFANLSSDMFSSISKIYCLKFVHMPFDCVFKLIDLSFAKEIKRMSVTLCASFCCAQDVMKRFFTKTHYLNLCHFEIICD